MTQKRAKLAESYIKHPLIYRDGKFCFVYKNEVIALTNNALDMADTWYLWCHDQETVDMANIYLTLLED